MKFHPKSKQGFRLWTIGSILGLISLGVLFFFGRHSSASADYFSTFALLIFMILVVVTGGFLYVLRTQVGNEVVESYLNNRIDELVDKLEVATEGSEHKSIYLENMSHEIRIPLSTILGMIRMLKNTDLDSDQQAQLEIAEYSSEHLLQLINMVLNNSKNLDTDLKIEQVPIRLKSDFIKLFKIFEYQAWENNLDFSYKFLIDKKQDFLLLGDFAKIQQVLINLVNNAIKYTNNGKIEITIDHKVTYDNLQVVSFFVKDTGIGMSDFEQSQTLSRLEQKNIMTPKYYKGSGIGLAVSKKLIELMGGELKFESKENEGSTFYFSLQLQKTLNVIEEPPNEVPILLNKYDYKFSVLVAEDNKVNQKVIRFLLEKYGAECTFVTNGLDAVNLYKVINFDMVFMDIYMPKINGYEATKIIKNSDKYQKNNIPIVAVSASAFEEDIKKAKGAGVDEFLAKPIDSKKLNSVLRKYALKKEEQVS